VNAADFAVIPASTQLPKPIRPAEHSCSAGYFLRWLCAVQCLAVWIKLNDMQEETGALLQITRVKGLGPRRIKRLVDGLGSASDALNASAGLWAQAIGYRLDRAEQAKAQAVSSGTLQWVEEESRRAKALGVSLIGVGTPDYPPLLAQAIDAPPVLWVRGQLLEKDQASLAIVGARKCTGYGREQAERFGYHTADAGLTVVSGGAYGIDAAAHRGALNSGGDARTIVVLGSAVDQPYPKEHASLFDEVADGRGAVISELPLGTGPHHSHFLPRNRIIACASLGTLVIEAAVRSGSLNTARRAVEEGRPAMYLPGRVDSLASAGCHQLIRAGEGELVHGIADVLETLGEATTLIQGAAERSAAKQSVATETRAASDIKPDCGTTPLGLSETQQAIWDALASAQSLDDLIQFTCLLPHVVNAELTMIEIRGLIKRSNGLLMRHKDHR